MTADEAELKRLSRRINDRFVKAFATFRLIEDGDHILVGLSGGKDSLCLLDLLAKRSRIMHPQFTVEAIHVRMKEISYESSADYLENFCHERGVPFHLVKSSISDAGNNITEEQRLKKQKQPCFLCSWYRRKAIFNMAQSLGCNKIAFGHHQDDLLHTAIMNQLFQGRFETMPARLQMRKMPLTIIRPLCMMAETDIARYAELCHFRKQTKQCPYEHESNRTVARHLFEEAERLNPEARYSLWNALMRDGNLT